MVASFFGGLWRIFSSGDCTNRDSSSVVTRASDTPVQLCRQCRDDDHHQFFATGVNFDDDGIEKKMVREGGDCWFLWFFGTYRFFVYFCI